MNLNVAFFIRHFTERGTENSIFNYAFYNQEILGNKSVIIAFNKIVSNSKKPFINTSRKVFEKEFKIVDIKYIEELKKVIEEEKISHAYIQSHGFYRDFYDLNRKDIWGNCQTIYHYVFGPMARQGSNIRCVIGKDLNRRYNKRISVLPYIVNKHKYFGTLRDDLNIKKSNLVIGRHGGFDTFDISFVKKAISKIIKIRKDIFFIFLNTEKFIEHERIIHLPKTTSFEFKSKFIDTCDFMLHARKDGETFGLSVAEFSAANKPIISYEYSKDKEHLRILNEKAIKYKNQKDLFDILLRLDTKKFVGKNWNCYEMFEPKKVIKQFEKICLKERSESKINWNELFLDIPWEIYIIFRGLIFKTIRIFIKVIPINYKTRFKSFFKTFIKL